jgi:hypothetical protein
MIGNITGDQDDPTAIPHVAKHGFGTYVGCSQVDGNDVIEIFERELLNWLEQEGTCITHEYVDASQLCDGRIDCPSKSFGVTSVGLNCDVIPVCS